jgi:acyl dehydratase
MITKNFNSIDEIKQAVGTDVATSDWEMITQEQLNKFSNVAGKGDSQWIHVDVEKAKAGPFGTTIVHGFLTLSLIPGFLNECMSFPPANMSINYGMDKVRFPDIVPVDSKLRGHFHLSDVKELDNCYQMNWLVTIEREGSTKPACVAEFIVRKY